jgi:hypothetical protein
MDAGHGTGVNAIGNALAHLGNDGVGHEQCRT